MRTTRHRHANRTICAVAVLAIGLCRPAWSQPVDLAAPESVPAGRLIGSNKGAGVGA